VTYVTYTKKTAPAVFLFSFLSNRVMKKEIEPSAKKAACPYCGSAPINHALSYCESLISVGVDGRMMKVVKYSPSFIKDLAEWIPVSLFKVFVSLNYATFSSDIDGAASFRSRIIWEEARKRGIVMEQLVLFGKPLDHYRAVINGATVYFESIPIPSESLDMEKNWDDKIVLKKEFSKHGIPVPSYVQLPLIRGRSLQHYFSLFKTPIIVKPQVGSRGRHTVTNIHTFDQFRQGVAVVKKLCPYVAVEEHLEGPICRATLVGGVLAGFYRGQAPFIVGDGKKTIQKLIEEKDAARKSRVEIVPISDELHGYIGRSGFVIDDILPADVRLFLSHHVGRLFGGTTKEMIDDLHPSFIPILEQAAAVTGLAIAGFDCIIPDPTADASSQRWGIIECNTLPFIDLHYYALEGRPRNIAGMVWDLWK
jgi:cyanophycin synthetase